MQSKFLLVLGLGLFLGACSGSDDPDAGMLFDDPHLSPDSNLACINYQRVLVDGTASYGVVLRNDGKPQLMISDARIEGDTRGHFTLTGPDITTVESTEAAVMQIVYAPTAEGWDTARVIVDSNAENYPMGFEMFILALGRPTMDPDTYDPGPKPAEAVGANGEETCPPM